MTESASDEQIAAALAYEDLHVPALFRQWAPWVLDAAKARTGQRILDVACGTGVLAREAAERVGQTGFVAGIDADRGMLKVAERIAPGIEWRNGAAESLPYKEGSFDAVVSQFGLMFFSDRLRAVREMFRVLVPGGRLATAVWASLDESPAYLIEVELLERLAGPRAADAVRAPFVLGSKDELTALFERAGAAYLAVTTRVGTARFPSIRSMVEADLRGWLPVMGVVLTEDQIGTVLSEAEAALDRYADSQGNAVFDTPGHIVTAIKP